MIQNIPCKYNLFPVYYNTGGSPQPPAPSAIPLTFEAINGSPTVALEIIQGTPFSISLKYKVNNGSWTAYTIGNGISLNNGDTVAFSGANDHFNLYSGGDNYYSFTTSNGQVDVYGNLMSLVNYASAGNDQNQFMHLFENNTNIVNASGIILPAVHNNYAILGYLFQNCTSLVSIPVLSAQLYNGGYDYYCMFYGCTSLPSAKIAITGTPGGDWANNLFYNCSSLSSIDVNFTSWKGTTAWVVDVAANGTFYCPTALGTNETISRGFSYCPTNWTVVNI